MKTIINPLLISAFIFLQTAFVLSQNHNTLKKYNFSFSVMGGESIFAVKFILTDNSYSNTQPNLNVSGTYYLSDSKALKVDAGYTFTKPYSGLLEGDGNSRIEGSNMFSSKVSFLIGRFKPDEHFMYNFSIGLGVHVWKPGSLTDIDFNYKIEYQTEVNVLASVGGSVEYRFTKRFGICAEAEFDMITGNRHSYFPLRGGVFYIF